MPDYSGIVHAHLFSFWMPVLPSFRAYLLTLRKTSELNNQNDDDDYRDRDNQQLELVVKQRARSEISLRFIGLRGYLG
jgi:hypothetical protein